MGRKHPKFSVEQWMQRQAQIYYLRCFKGMSGNVITELLNREGRERGFTPTIADVKKQMTAWEFRHGEAWDMDKCPQSFLEYIIGRSSSSCSLQCSFLPTSPACRICAGPATTELCTEPHFHSHDTFVVADEGGDPNVKTYHDGRCRRRDRSEKPTSSTHLYTPVLEHESLSFEPPATLSRSAVDETVQLNLPVSDALHGYMPMDFQHDFDYFACLDAARPPTDAASNVGQSLSFQFTGREQHRSPADHPQLDLPLQMCSAYNEFPNTGPEYRSSTDMSVVGHAPFSMLYLGEP